MYKSLRSHKDAPHTAKAVFMQQLWAVLAGLTLIAAYASHGRMLALTAAGVVLELIVLITMKRRLFSLVGFFTSCAGGFVIDKFLKHYIQAELWLSGTKEKASVNTIENMFSRISNIDAEKLEHFPQTLFGHFFYFISSTWGFGAVCIVLIFSGIVMYYVSRRRIRNSDEAPVTAEGKPQTYIGTSLAIFCWYALLAMGAIFVVSVAFKATSSVYDTRADTAIFGRYIETFFPIAIFPALIMIYRRRFTAKHCFGALLVASFVFVMTEMFTVSAVVGDGSTTKNIVGAMILGIAPLRIGEGLKDTITETTFLKIIGVVMLLLLALVIARLIKKRGESLFNIVTIPLGALLIYTTLYGFDNYTVVQGKNAQYGANYVTQALSMIDDCPYCGLLDFLGGGYPDKIGVGDVVGLFDGVLRDYLVHRFVRQEYMRHPLYRGGLLAGNYEQVARRDRRSLFHDVDEPQQRRKRREYHSRQNEDYAPHHAPYHFRLSFLEARARALRPPC